MRQLLCLSCSARQSRSLTRELLDAFVQEWRTQYPDDLIQFRDVGKTPPTIISEDWIAGAFSHEPLTMAQHKALNESDELIAEFVASDLIVFATPMYNYGMPAALKAWFDQTVRINKTFDFDLARGDNPCAPLHTGKMGVILSASGEGGLLGHDVPGNHLHAHIEKASHLLGIETFQTIGIEYQEFGDERFELSVQQAHRRIPSLIQELNM